jgi:acetyl-CoA synthetase
LVVAVLGSLRAGCVPTVLFSSFGPLPVERRLALGHARLLVTTAHLYRDKVEPIRARLPDLERVLVVDGPGRLAATAARDRGPEGTDDFGAWLAQGDASFRDADVGPEAPSLLHFTSGTTGEPKGVVHVHEAVVAHAHTGREVLGLGPGTRYWCTADPGWVTGVSYGILAPLARGCTIFMDEDEFEAQRWWDNLASEAIEVFYTSPTALRLLRVMDAAVEHPALPHLRATFSVGEPLARVEADWARDVLGAPVHDTWWQTETGAIVVATPIAQTPRPGRIGPAVAGYEVACLDTSGAGVARAAPGTPGELAVRAGWPSMFRAYLDQPDLYAAAFRDGWYLSGDVAEMDQQGWFTYVGRRDDIFKSAGHLVSPAEVEEVLLAHGAVVDAGVWGRQDPVAGTLVEAHVMLAAGYVQDEELRREILAFARRRLGPALAPRALHFRDHLPRTPSGKIVRKDLGSTLP